MIITIICALTILFACTIGATVGFGGGVIIKPVLDSMNFCTVDTVNFISSCSVFAMSISSIIRQKRQKAEVKPKIVLLLSAGAVTGGYLGNGIFSHLLTLVDNDLLKGIQAVIITIFVAFAIFFVNKKNLKTLKIKNPAVILLTGLALGTLNSFLGIGGGPINITVLLLLFSLATKQGAVYSISIVFFCQLSNLITLFFRKGFTQYGDFLPLIICAVICAVIGGIAGSTLNKKLSDKVIRIIFSLVMVFVFSVNIYNAVTGLIQ